MKKFLNGDTSIQTYPLNCVDPRWKDERGRAQGRTTFEMGPVVFPKVSGADVLSDFFSTVPPSSHQESEASVPPSRHHLIYMRQKQFL